MFFKIIKINFFKLVIIIISDLAMKYMDPLKGILIKIVFDTFFVRPIRIKVYFMILLKGSYLCGVGGHRSKNIHYQPF